MKLAKFLLLFLPYIMFIAGYSQQQAISFDDKKWAIEGQGYIKEGFKGKNSLYLQNGIAWLKDEKILNGIIEFDMYQFQRTSFSGVIFRMTDSKNYEDIYLRSQQSGYPDAFQYTPVFNGNAGWQLYHDQFDAVNDGFVSWRPKGILNGYNAVAFYPFDRWMHVKLVVKGTSAELFLDNNEEPAAFIKELKMGEHAGSIGVKSGVGAAYFSNFSFIKTDNPPFKNKQVKEDIRLAAGYITSWLISSAFSEKIITGKDQLDSKFQNSLTWQKLPAEKEGFVNISRLSLISDSANTVLAKLVVTSDKDQVKKLSIGYSDRIKVFCNGIALYEGNTGYRTRDFRYLGTMGFFDAVYIPLKKGENIILCAVSETFGGWGLMGKFENIDGITIKE